MTKGNYINKEKEVCNFKDWKRQDINDEDFDWSKSWMVVNIMSLDFEKKLYTIEK